MWCDGVDRRRGEDTLRPKRQMTKVISVSLPGELVDELDDEVDWRNSNRSETVAEAIKMFIEEKDE